MEYVVACTVRDYRQKWPVNRVSPLKRLQCPTVCPHVPHVQQKTWSSMTVSDAIVDSGDSIPNHAKCSGQALGQLLATAYHACVRWRQTVIGRKAIMYSSQSWGAKAHWGEMIWGSTTLTPHAKLAVYALFVNHYMSSFILIITGRLPAESPPT